MDLQEKQNDNSIPVITVNDFYDEILKERLQKIKTTLAAKNKEYGSSKNKLHNFDESARIKCLPPYRVLDIFMLKHITSYNDIMDKLENNETVTLELLDEKLGDIINYFLLQEIILKREIMKRKEDIQIR
jgi:hypothetical protein